VDPSVDLSDLTRQYILSQPGSDAYEVVPGSQLVVARTAHRNNSSKYTINDRNSTFSEVTTLLKSRGIDLDHKRFLILQVCVAVSICTFTGD
jgi:structural maintenance of chromosome 4